MSTNGLAQRRYSRTPLQQDITDSANRYSTHRDTRLPASRESCAGPTFPPPRHSSKPTTAFRHASQPVQQSPRKVTKASPAAKQPRQYQGDAVQWDNLRSQGYVLRGSVSIPAVSEGVVYQQSIVTDSPNIRYAPDPVYHQATTYRVHPDLRTTPHIAQPSGHPAPEAAFLSQARYAPAPQQTTPYPATPKRPKMHSQASSITMRTLRAQQDLHRSQLKPGSVFMYERPSKASYLDNEEAASRYIHSRPSSRAASASGSHHEARSSSRLSRHSASLPFIPFQPEYPPAESLCASLQLPSRPASRVAQSTPLLRQETDVSFYSQSTFPESYAEVMQQSGRQRASRASIQRSILASSHRASYPLETARTEMTLGTAQDLWRDLYHELLSTDDAGVSDTHIADDAYLQTPRPPDLDDNIDIEYDFRQQFTALRSPSPVPIQRLKSTKKVAGSPVRPQLVRQSPVKSTYEDTARQLVDRALKASLNAMSPERPAMPYISGTSLGHDSSRKSAANTGDATQAVGSLTRQLRAKTPSTDITEDSAMQQLALQSAPSEVDDEESTLAFLQTASTGSEEDAAFHLGTVTSSTIAQATLTRLSAVCGAPQAVSAPQQRAPVRLRASRIPVPIARKAARTKV